MIEDANRSFNLWKVLLVLARRKKFIGGFVSLATILAIIISLLLPKWYQAKTSILPSQHDQITGLTDNLTQLLMTSAGFELPVMATPSDVYAAILKSATVARGVIEDNHLMTYLKINKFQKCQLYLRDKTKIKVTPEGVVELYFEDRNPEMAARVANSYVANLDKLNREVNTNKARGDKEFIRQRLESTKIMLDSARSKLLTFQKENKALDLARQKSVAISAASELKTKMTLAQVTLDVKKRLYSADHPEVQRLENELTEMRKQLSSIENGSNNDSSYFSVALSKMPSLSFRYGELEAEVTVQTKIYDLLTGMYEEAQLKEQKDTPTIAVLEKAYPPEIKYKPKRSLIVIFTFASSLVLSIFISLFADYLENLRRLSPADFELMNQVKNEIAGKRGYSGS